MLKNNYGVNDLRDHRSFKKNIILYWLLTVLLRYDQTYIKDNSDEGDHFQYPQPGPYVLHLLGLGPPDLGRVLVRIDSDLDSEVAMSVKWMIMHIVCLLNGFF